MSTDPRPYAPNVALGLGIASVGVALLLDRLGLADARVLLQYWPVLVILLGASIVWEALFGREEAARPSQRLLVSPGLVVLLIIVGAIATRADLRRPFQSGSSTSETLNVTALLGGSRQVSEAMRFRGADVTTVMGGSRLDLRKATIPDGEEAVIDVFTLMGGVEVLVPRHWTVVVDLVPVMGSVEDRRARQSAQDVATDEGAGTEVAKTAPSAIEPGTPPPSAETTANPPRLVVRGFLMMGGVQIKLR
jgi:hypothetical protein